MNNCQRGSLGNFDHYAYGNFDHYAYGNKVQGAGDTCRRQGIVFLPMAVESFGGWHEVAEREVKKLGAALAGHTGQEKSEAFGAPLGGNGGSGLERQRGNLGKPGAFPA